MRRVLLAAVVACAVLAGLRCGNGEREQSTSSPEPADGASDARTSDRSASDGGTGEDAPLSMPSACAEGGGDSWTTFAAFTQDTLMGLSGTGSHDVWAAGLSSLWHWDGSTWTAAPPPPGITPFNSARIWTGAPNDLWFATGVIGPVWHWAGQAWTSYSPHDNRAIVYLWGNSVSDVWGTDESADYSGHWDGTSWKEISAFPNGPIWGSGAADLWAAAVEYSATDSGDQRFFPMCHWTGSSWTADAGVAPSVKHAIWGSQRTDVWAVGDGTAVHFDGNAWSNDVTLPTRQSLFGIWGSSSSDVWAVGAGAVILHFDGTTWSTSPSPTGGATLHAVWGSDRCDAWAVGEGGLVVRLAP